MALVVGDFFLVKARGVTTTPESRYTYVPLKGPQSVPQPIPTCWSGTKWPYGNKPFAQRRRCEMILLTPIISAHVTSFSSRFKINRDTVATLSLSSLVSTVVFSSQGSKLSVSPGIHLFVKNCLWSYAIVIAKHHLPGWGSLVRWTHFCQSNIIWNMTSYASQTVRSNVMGSVTWTMWHRWR